MRTKKTPIRFYVGIDPSKNNTGLSIWDSKSGTLLCRTFPAKGTTQQLPTEYKKDSLHFIDALIHDIVYIILGASQPPNSIIVIEDYAYGAKGRTFELAEICGMIKNRILFDEKLPRENLYICTTQHLKMFCSGKGNVPKDVVMKDVYKNWGFDTNVNDEADAYVLMKIAEALAGNTKGLSAYQKDIIDRIKKHNEIKK